MGVETSTQQLVVYVVLVRQERVTSVPYAARHHPYHVKTWMMMVLTATMPTLWK